MIHMSEPIETAELLAFARTVEAKSLSRAAAELRVPRATLSRRLARLEHRLSTRLLLRTTRNLALTDAGEALYKHARRVLDAVADAEASVRRTDDAIRGDLRVSVPPLLTRGIRLVLVEFAKTYPGVRLQIDVSTHHVDFFRGGYDVAVRTSADLPPGLVARTLLHTRLVAVASSGYLQANGVPRARTDLRKHACLMGFTHGSIPATHWPTLRGGKVRVSGTIFSNDLRFLCEAALAGLGIALLPTFIVDEFLKHRELVHVLVKTIGSDAKTSVVYPEREFLPPTVRAFIDLVSVRVPQELTGHGEV
jgi:DNA-binding transcriptional LysR family regulator